MTSPPAAGAEQEVERGFHAPACEKCGSEKDWCDCWNCGGEGYSYHDCGEDTCCCLDPEDNVRCDICYGKGGFYVCGACFPGAFND